MEYNRETLTEVMADRKRVVDLHAALETSLQTQEKLHFPFHLFMFLASSKMTTCVTTACISKMTQYHIYLVSQSFPLGLFMKHTCG